MKRFSRVIVAALALVLCFALCACGNKKYASRYSSSMMVKKSTTNKESISFGTFSGVYVMEFKNTSDEVRITYNATLEKGNIKVYFDYNDEKSDLFEIGTDGSVEGKTEAFKSNQTIYVIIESDGKCTGGSFSVALEKA
ncbi:MAG: hypothetical protein K2F90_00105 [Clostridiales bacterium]|nr:hypothetical protein [Clostridiales bacterium]